MRKSMVCGSLVPLMRYCSTAVHRMVTVASRFLLEHAGVTGRSVQSRQSSLYPPFQ